MDLRLSISSNSDSSIDLERRETIFDKGDFDPTWRPSDDDFSADAKTQVEEPSGVKHHATALTTSSSRLSLELTGRVSELEDGIESSLQDASLLQREAPYSIEPFDDFTSSKETRPTPSLEASLGLLPAETATSKESICFYCEGHATAAAALLDKYGVIPEPHSWASATLKTVEELPPHPSPAQVKSFLQSFEAMIKSALKEFFKKKLLSEPDNRELQALLEKDFYGERKNLKRAFQEELNKVRNTAPWAIIERNISFIDQTGATHSMTSRMIPASKTVALQSSYARSAIEGVSSFDRKNRAHAINLWIDTLHGDQQEEAPLLTVVRSGLHASIDLPVGDTIDSKTGREVLLELAAGSDARNLSPSPRQEAFDVRFNEALLASLESRGMLENSEEPIELTIVDIGLLSYEGEEKTMKEAQFHYLQAADGKERTLMTYKRADGEKVTLRVKLKIFAFNFGVQSYDKTLGQFYSQPVNDASLDALLGEGGAVDQVLEGRSIFNGKQLTPDDQLVIKELAEQCKSMRSQGTINAYDSDYYAFTARLVVLCDKLGMTPNIHCKSGKDRTSRLVEESKVLAAQIETRLKTRTRDQQDVVPAYTGKALTDLTQIEMNLAFALGSGNGGLQQLNTGVRGNKQSQTLAWKLDVAHLKKELQESNDPATQKRLQSSIEKIEFALREYAGLSALAKS